MVDLKILYFVEFYIYVLIKDIVWKFEIQYFCVAFLVYEPVCVKVISYCSFGIVCVID